MKKPGGLTKIHPSQRGYFAVGMYNVMAKYDDVYFLTADLGYGMLDIIRDGYQKRFINVGASEQSMLDIAVGLAYSGKIPVCYSITPFLLFRAAETIRTYINHESLNVKLVGGGRGNDYEHDGFSHFAGDDLTFLSQFENINLFIPHTKEDAWDMAELLIKHEGACYLNLTR